MSHSAAYMSGLAGIAFVLAEGVGCSGPRNTFFDGGPPQMSTPPLPATTSPATPTSRQTPEPNGAEAAGSGRFAIHLVSTGPGPLARDYDDAGGAWSDLLATARLGDLLVTDRDIETVGTNPLTLVLTTDAGRRLGTAQIDEIPFIVTLDDTRLYAGAVLLRGTARALNHPVVQRIDNGLSVNLVVVPAVGATADTSRNAPTGLVEHFRQDGKLLAPGARPEPRTRRRRLVAEVARGDTPGARIEQVEARCDDETGTCALARWSRPPGTPAGHWDPAHAVALQMVDFEALWSTAAKASLFVTLPSALATSGRTVGPPPTRMRFGIEAERMDGTVISNGLVWSTPSLVDARVGPFFAQAEVLARKLVPTMSR